AAFFHTNDDDKDDDTVLSIGIVLPDGTLVASVAGITGRFPDQHDNGPFSLTVFGKHSRDELKGSVATLHIETNGDDTWKFNWTMVLAFDDGTQNHTSWSGPFLSDEVRDRAYALNVSALRAGFVAPKFTFPAPGAKIRQPL